MKRIELLWHLFIWIKAYDFIQKKGGVDALHKAGRELKVSPVPLLA